MTYRLSLAKRLRVAARRKERYRTEPDYRLRQINAARVARGRAPLSSLNEVGATLCQFAAMRQRDEAGRFA